MNNSVLFSSIMNFISGIVDDDEGVITSIASENTELRYKDGRLTFMISGLYRQLVMDSQCVVEKRFLPVSFKEFRHLLYASDLNAQLEKIGHVIAVCSPDNNTAGKVDTNWYELKPLSP
ncbi:MAG: hypothetical protein ACJAUP_003840 [Cellvibrionaceae bacterium]|jgi:hypothetical protein